MTNQFVDYETAKMASLLGLETMCIAYYTKSKNLMMPDSINYPKLTNKEVWAPTWQQVKQWLWEKYGIAVHYEWLSSFYSRIEQMGETQKGGLTPHKSPITAEIDGIKATVNFLHTRMLVVAVTPNEVQK